ncbi:hypothetical protein CKA32_000260 [Geitlerinema sp. FC II]|nr:hypothetical protein CKA32_000260 [Geitlerinema sp. FC II]
MGQRTAADSSISGQRSDVLGSHAEQHGESTAASRVVRSRDLHYSPSQRRDRDWGNDGRRWVYAGKHPRGNARFTRSRGSIVSRVETLCDRRVLVGIPPRNPRRTADFGVELLRQFGVGYGTLSQRHFTGTDYGETDGGFAVGRNCRPASRVVSLGSLSGDRVHSLRNPSRSRPPSQRQRSHRPLILLYDAFRARNQYDLVTDIASTRPRRYSTDDRRSHVSIALDDRKR